MNQTTSVTAVLHAAGDIRLEERKEVAPAKDEVQLRIRSTGLCGSDLSYYLKGRNGDFALRSPLVLGHESSGEVVAVGDEVKHLKVGDRVAIEAGVPCGGCNYCKCGRYNLCGEIKFRSSAKTFPHVDGTLRSLADRRIPDSMPFTVAALLEPLSVSLHGLRRASPAPGHTSFVIGAGAVGLLTAALSKYYGASRVIISDIDQGRIDFALENGFADDNYLMPTGKHRGGVEALEEGREVVDIIRQLSSDKFGFDNVWECTGVESCVQKAVFATRPGGTLALLGMGTPVQTFATGAASLREVDVIGVFRYANTYPAAIAIASSGRLPDLRKLVTHRFGLNHAANAFNTAKTGKDKDGRLVVKVVIDSEI